MSTFDVQVGGKEAESDGRNVARMYVPTLQERVHTAMLGPFGLGLEIVNFILSMLIFLAYIAELYDADIYYSHSRLAVEAFATTFFIFDFALHLFVASDPWRYVFTAHGVIDLVTIIPSLVMFIDPNSRSSLMFVFRVLRICRALRVLRLAHYVQLKKHSFEYELLSRVNDYEMASELLDANATKTSALKDMLLARASVCPGSSTLILNLIRSYYIGQYIKRPTWRKKWIREYLDGMTYQVFPIMFSNRFHRRKFDVVARHMYEKYCVLLVSALSTKENWNAGSSCDTTPVNPIQLVPFGSRIREGDIGFVIAKSASDVMGIVNSYGYWDDSSGGGRRQSENLLSPTRLLQIEPRTIDGENLRKTLIM
ncbi:hypothetical protein PHYBOEH_010305 [Phytophthora boehmeriae]|uniref:Voltage-gated Ion Channel (VIC) Superfamily n=1 Tax=Phytophthora boehmeriae TaxID=109152 RepID=A0A8T1X6M7_9STRA|nr:hypothetical protein PHYBOEH_010305 [Phytophthora boehmeriae]